VGAQSQPGQVDTLSEENDLGQSIELKGTAGGESLPLGEIKYVPPIPEELGGNL